MSNSETPSVRSKIFLVLPKAEFKRNIFGSPLLHALIRSFYLWGILAIFMLAVVLSPVFLFPLIALLISRWRYAVTKYEKDVEKHGDFIADIRKKVFAETGIQLESFQVIRLWMNRMIITDDWVFTVKSSSDDENFEVVGLAREK